MGRRKNAAIGAVAYSRDRRLAAFAAGLVDAGIPTGNGTAEIMAEGYVARLRRLVWLGLDDYIGTADDVEQALNWHGPPRVLALLLKNGGWLKEIEGLMYGVDAVTESPHYVKERWRRHAADKYEQAMRRGARTSIPCLSATPQEAEELLFGEGVTKEESATYDKAHKRIVARYHDLYLAKYGAKYPWRPKDFKIIERLRAAVGDAAIADVFARYLGCAERFYAGHELGKLLNQLPRFSGGTGKAGGGGTDPAVGSDASIDGVTVTL